jgi:orotate phosphoribosyltransferase
MGDKKVALAERFMAYSREINALELVPEGRPLKSGRVSYYFFDSGKFSSGVAMRKISSEYARIIVENFREDKMLAFDLLYGPPYKGTILVPSIAVALNALGCGNINFCSSRKERKNHGEGGFHIGTPIRKGSRVLIIDDVITAGGTKREAVEYIRSYGGVPIGLVIAFDRQERGTTDLSAAQEFEREYAIPVCAIATLTNLISFLEKSITGSYDAKSIATGILAHKIRAYSEQYGVK